MSETITLEGWQGPWPDDDKDANLKADIALYAHVDPLRTVRGLSESIDVPVGAIVHYVMARWASEGASGLLELGPTEATGTDAARLAAYDRLRQMISWLNYPLEHPEVYDT
jgi:hypothetical protein